jgi:ubiquinone/menaquinone biosynthesis C-methylase UbiE
MGSNLMSIDYYAIYDTEYTDSSDIDFLSYALKAGSALEIGCGTGRIISKLKDKRPDIDFSGIDIDDLALEIAKKKINGSKEIFYSDATEFISKKKYENIYFMFNGLMHIEGFRQQNALNNFHCNLVDGGKLFLAISNPCLKRMNEDFSYYKYQKTLNVLGYNVDKFEFNRYDLTNQKITRVFNYDYIEVDGCLKRLQSRFNVWYLFKQQLEMMLKIAGFEINEIYGDFHKTRWSADSDLIIVDATKI